MDLLVAKMVHCLFLQEQEKAECHHACWDSHWGTGNLACQALGWHYGTPRVEPGGWHQGCGQDHPQNRCHARPQVGHCCKGCHLQRYDVSLLEEDRRLSHPTLCEAGGGRTLCRHEVQFGQHGQKQAVHDKPLQKVREGRDIKPGSIDLLFLSGWSRSVGVRWWRFPRPKLTWESCPGWSWPATSWPNNPLHM